MEFKLTHQQIKFEIPDEWWDLAGMKGFNPPSECYAVSSPESDSFPFTVVLLKEVQAPVRSEGVAWFQKERMVKILRGMRERELIPPIEVDEPPAQGTFQYRVRNGFHRFYASAAVGFTHLPVLVKPYFDIRAL